VRPGREVPGQFARPIGRPRRCWSISSPTTGRATIRGEVADRRRGKKLRVWIGEVEHEAFAPGSSGWPEPGGRPVRWVELFLWGGNAWELFGRPASGTTIQVLYDL